MKALNIVSTLILLFIANQANFAQKYYESSFTELYDTIYYPKMDRFFNEGKMDSILLLADDACNYYHDKGEDDRALFLFNLCTLYPAGFGMAKECIPIMENKIKFLKSSTDTSNVHYATLRFIQATSNVRLFNLETAKGQFNNAIEIFKQLENTPPLHYYDCIKSLSFLYAYINENVLSYKMSKEALEGFLTTDTTGFHSTLKSLVVHDIAYSYLTLAALMKQNNQLELSLAYNTKAYETFASLGYAYENESVSLNNMADAYFQLGQYDLALQYAHSASKIITSNNSEEKLKAVYNSTLATIGKVYMTKGQYPKADSTFRQLLYFMHTYFDKNEPKIVDPYILLAENFLKQEEIDSTHKYIMEASELDKFNPKVLKLVAMTAKRKKNFEQAIKFEKLLLCSYQTIPKFEEKSTFYVNDFSNFYESSLAAHRVSTYFFLMYEEKGDEYILENSIYYACLSDSLMQKYRDETLIGVHDVILAEQYHSIANVGIDASYEAFSQISQNKYLEKILNFMAQATTFKLNAEVHQSNLARKIETTSERNKQIDLLNQIRRKEVLLKSINSDLDNALEKRLKEEIFNLKKEAFEYSFELQHRLDTATTTRNPNNEIHLKEIQKLLANNEALVSYFLTDEDLYTLFITEKYSLIHKANIDQEFHKSLKEFYRDIKTGSTNIESSGRKMYAYLMEPLEKQLLKINKIVIVPDGILNQIPYEALLRKKGNRNAFLIENFTISYTPSIFLWKENRKQKERNKELSFAGFAPVFKDNQPIDSLNPLSYNDELRSSFADIKNGDQLKPLKYSADEIFGIEKLFKQNHRKYVSYAYHDANETNLRNCLKDYFIIHIATHGFSSTTDPEESGLFLAPNFESNIEVTDDGFIYFNEISTFNTNADLVVLSACKTGAGKITTGEGVLALPRAFLYAGAKNVMASLWKIHDEKTKSMMISFYTKLLEGQPYAEALRQAKILQIKNGEQPLDWSGIVLIGE